VTAPIGAVVQITYDNSGEVISVGDWLRTPTGRAYQVLEVRTVQRGPNALRRHRLRCLVAAEAPDDARVHPLYWFSRD